MVNAYGCFSFETKLVTKRFSYEPSCPLLVLTCVRRCKERLMMYTRVFGVPQVSIWDYWMFRLMIVIFCNSCRQTRERAIYNFCDRRQSMSG